MSHLHPAGIPVIRLIPLAAILCLAPLSGALAAVLSVGPGKTYARPCAAIAAARAGDVVEIEGNTTYAGDVCYIAASNITIRGVRGRPKIDAAGKNAAGKGVYVVTGNNVTVENLEIHGAKVPDKNGAAFRVEGANFTLRYSFLHDNENGILTNAHATSNIVLEYNEFGRNGDGTGQTHNIYVGAIASLVFRYNYSHDANVGHNVKSRAKVNSVLYNRFSSLNPGETGSTAAGRPSYEIDLPNGGVAYVIGNVIQQPSTYINNSLLSFGAEAGGGVDDALFVVNNTFINSGASGIFVNVPARVKNAALIQNNLFAGKGTLTNQAFAVQRSNYQADVVQFANRAAYDLHPAPHSAIVGAGTDPGLSPQGVALRPTMEYVHVAGAAARPAGLKLDIGAYQVAAPATTTLSTPR